MTKSSKIIAAIGDSFSYTLKATAATASSGNESLQFFCTHRYPRQSKIYLVTGEFIGWICIDCGYVDIDPNWDFFKWVNLKEANMNFPTI